MDAEEKIEQIEYLIKNNFLPSPSGPKKVKAPNMDIATNSIQPAAPEAPKTLNNQSKKDPTKVAAQIETPDAKEAAKKQAEKMKEGITVNKLGQWSLNTKR